MIYYIYYKYFISFDFITLLFILYIYNIYLNINIFIKIKKSIIFNISNIIFMKSCSIEKFQSIVYVGFY